MTIQTEAALLRAYGEPLGIEAITLDEPGPGEVVVRLGATGVCHSDFHMLDGGLNEGPAKRRKSQMIWCWNYTITAPARSHLFPPKSSMVGTDHPAAMLAIQRVQ